MQLSKFSVGGVLALAAIVLPLSLTAPSTLASAAGTPDQQSRQSTDRSPAALAALLARYDEMPDGPARNALALQIDAVAAQRYATVSRLFWYTDLDRAKAAAAAQGKPILSLRMLGRLDEDRSCANSRFFRTTLYANTSVGKLLREKFILHWSTERPVPQVTIDMGDGRRIETTTTGNSAHYILDEKGRVVDALPGLYAPAAFETELGKSLQLARSLRGLTDDARQTRLATHHERERTAALARAAALGDISFIAGGRRLLSSTDAVRAAQQATMMKSAVEIPVLAQLGKDVTQIPESDRSQWAALGQAYWNFQPRLATSRNPHEPAGMALRVLDVPSANLVKRVYEQGQTPDPGMATFMISRLEHDIVADTALNELRLRPVIRRVIAAGTTDFTKLNDFVYASVFHTPRGDTWLGLVTRRDFTGLPGDGIVTARP